MTTKKQSRERRAAQNGGQTGLGWYDGNHWAEVRAVVRAGLQRTLTDIGKGELDQMDLIKLSGFCHTAMRMLDKAHPAQWAAARVDVDLMDKIAQEWEVVNAEEAAKAEAEARAEEDRRAAALEADEREAAAEARRRRAPRTKYLREKDA